MELEVVSDDTENTVQRSERLAEGNKLGVTKLLRFLETVGYFGGLSLVKRKKTHFVLNFWSPNTTYFDDVDCGNRNVPGSQEEFWEMAAIFISEVYSPKTKFV